MDALDSPAEPWSIQLEVGVAGRLDEHRLRTAVAEALGRHAMARARAVPTHPSDRQRLWEVTEEPDLDPLRIVDCPTDESLMDLRAELYSTPVALSESPPLRVRLARRSAGDLLLLNVNHAAFDGFGAVRLLSSVARAYAGNPDPPPTVTLGEAREIDHLLAAPDLRTKLRRLRLVISKLLDLVRPPSWLAPEGATAGPGYGFHHVSLSAEETRVVSTAEATVNDVLLAALHLTADGWNAEHDTPCRRVGVLVPVNLRPGKWREDVVTNLVLQARVLTRPGDRETVAAAVASVGGQSGRIKGGGGGALIEVLGGWSSWPQWAKRCLSPFVTATGHRLVDTAILSNLGQVDLPSFEGSTGEVGEAWFSAPARMPCGLSLGVITVGGRMHLSFRYRRSLFGPAAARRFAARYLAELPRVAAR